MILYKRSIKSIPTRFFVVGGSIFGSFIIYPLSVHPKINGPLTHLLWTLLGRIFGAGSPHNGVAGILFLFMSIILTQILGSLMGGLIGLRVGLTFFNKT